MCACEPGWLCPRCRDTPHDPLYFLNEEDPKEPGAWDCHEADEAPEWVTK